MPLGDYDPETLEMLYGVFDAACNELGTAQLAVANAAQAKIAVSKKLLSAADSGERDPDKLKLLALQGIVAV